MRIIECTQGEPDWHAARTGKVTASRVADIVRVTRSGPSRSRETYLGEIVAERLSGGGAWRADYVSQAMQWGKDNEQGAREMYAFATGLEVVTVGFVLHPQSDFAGCSPDGLAGEDGLVEIKCPNSATHIQSLLGAPIDPDYVKQMQWQLACTGRQWCDFVSFDPRMPPEMQIDIRRVIRNDSTILELELAVSAFLAEVDETCAHLLKKYRQPLAAE